MLIVFLKLWGIGFIGETDLFLEREERGIFKEGKKLNSMCKEGWNSSENSSF